MITILFHRRALCAGDDINNGVNTIELPEGALLGDLLEVLCHGGHGNDWPLQWNHEGWDIYSNIGVIAWVSCDLKRAEYYIADSSTPLSALGIKWVFGEYKGDVPDMTTLKWRFMDWNISIEEIPVESIGEFWDAHIKYLVDDEIITDDEDIEYFSGEEYRGILEDHMRREKDRHHMVYFLKEGTRRIGAASYCIYKTEDGKCFLMDFWVFPNYRGDGMGHLCFEALEKYTREQGALYYEINSTKEDSIRFWKSLGFVENGTDEYDMPLFVKR